MACRAHVLSRLSILLVTFALFFASFYYFVSPWYVRWGASSVELSQTLPGDDIVPGATYQTTRAITIDAGIDRVWPWLAQLGQDRGGFYSFDLLENLVGCAMPTVDVLRPDRQAWQLGDRLWMYPADKAGGIGFATLRRYVPGRALAFATHVPGSTASVEDGSWSFVLVPLDDYTTRLVIRGRHLVYRSVAGAAFDEFVFSPLHFVMERRTMIGLKQLAEGSDRARTANHVHVLLWTVTFVLFLTSIVKVMRSDRVWQPLAALVGSAIVFQVLTLGQPNLAVGAALVAWVVATLWWPPSRTQLLRHTRRGLQPMTH